MIRLDRYEVIAVVALVALVTFGVLLFVTTAPLYFLGLALSALVLTATQV